MPDLATIGLIDNAVVWDRYGTAGRGELTVSTPEIIRVRWVERSARKLDPKIDTVSFDAQVASTRDIPTGSLMRLAIARPTDSNEVVDSAGPDVNFTLPASLDIEAGDTLLIIPVNAPTKQMTCLVVSFEDGALNAQVQSLSGVAGGTYTDWVVLHTDNGLMEVVSTSRSKDLKGFHGIRREFGLKRFTGTLPRVVSS